jgi:hypothetical protein
MRRDDELVKGDHVREQVASTNVEVEGLEPNAILQIHKSHEAIVLQKPFVRPSTKSYGP